MVINFFGLLFLAVGILAAENATQPPIVPQHVTVYYESLCSDSINFFKNKLLPTYTDKSYNFTDLLSNLTIVPYGHVNETEHNYTCQHGPSECDGNRLHGCAVQYISNTTMLLDYIVCLMDNSAPKNKSAPYPLPKVCVSHVTDDILSKITNCYSTSEGSDLFAKNGQLTTTFFGAASGFSVPYISFNSTGRNDELSKKAIENFRGTLCSQYNVSNNFCSDPNKNGAASLSVAFALIPVTILLFFVRQ